VSIATPIGLLNGSTAYDNEGAGFHLVNTGDTRIEENVVYGNSTGIVVSNDYDSTSTTVIGNPDLSLERGNLVYGNSTGI
jgi:parallel beta-helix repeat protein